jgi:hypothetical protein
MRSSLALLPLLVVLGGCVPPSDSRPGLWLSGSASELPDDWSFTDSYREIALEVSAPHLLAHSVTIWCASLDGQLYVAARSPEDKRWPGWVDSDPDVRLGIDGRLYETRLAMLRAEDEIERVSAAYVAKYELPPRTPDSPPMRYWRVEPRS